MSFNTALIVDDSKLARIALKRKLEQRGLEIVMAEDARQALGLLENSSIDIVFMDHLMPEMDGFQATQEIKANAATAHLPVIMCSGKEKQGYLEEARAIGASNVLPKPAESEAIAAVFDELEALRAANEPAASEENAAAAPASGVSEAQIHNWLQPMSEQLGALSAQLISQVKSADDRFETLANSVQAIDARQLVVESLDVRQFKHEWTAQLEQRFAELAVPDTARVQAQLKQELAGELASEMGAQWDSKLSAAVAGLEALIEAAADESDSGAASQDAWMAQAEQRIIGQISESFSKLLEDKSHQLEASLQQSVEQSLQQKIASMRAELSEEFAAAPQPAAAEVELDVDALKQGLKAELIAELQQPTADAAGTTAETTQDVEAGDYSTGDVEQAVTEYAVEENEQPQMAVSLSQDPQLRQELTTMKMLTLATSLVAITATALHWF